MDAIGNIFENVWVQKGIWALSVVLFSALIYALITKFLNKKEKKNSKILSQKKNKTFIRMLKSIIGYILVIVTALMVLQIYGVDVSSMLAGVGIVSIIIGLALQDALKDIFRGFDIVSDGYYNIGDIVVFGENTGQVLSISLRSTKIKDIYSNNVVTIANRKIDSIEVLSDAIYLNIPMPYEIPVEKAEKILNSTLPLIKKDANVIDATFFGLNKITDSAMEYLFCVNCDPALRLSTRRKALHTIITTLEDNKISIPYPQLDIHTKK